VPSPHGDASSSQIRPAVKPTNVQLVSFQVPAVPDGETAVENRLTQSSGSPPSG
jgi:hypothetical protein